MDVNPEAEEDDDRNPNVRCTLVYSLTLSMANSLTFNNTMAQLTYLITDDTSYVGIASGTTGLIQLLIALPSAALADHFGRQLLLRVSSGVAFLCLGYMVYILLFLRRSLHGSPFFWPLLAGGCLWGVFMGLHSSALSALFGDSVPSGRRSKLYVWRASLRTLGNALGPAVPLPVSAPASLKRCITV